MKELSIEEKAKAYDEAIKAAKSLCKITTSLPMKEYMESIFPELKESEDERIRKSLVTLLQHFCKGYRVPGLDFPVSYKDMLDWVEKQCEQNPAWNEEDKEMFDYTLDMIEWYDGKNKKRVRLVSDWLKSLKDRVQPQPKQEWSQNDIDMIDWLIRCCEKEHEELCNDKYGHQDIVSDLKRDCRKKWNWLESLKNKVVPQNTWKPSEEQMKAIEKTLKYFRMINAFGETIDGLKELEEQLKKLREE